MIHVATHNEPNAAHDSGLPDGGDRDCLPTILILACSQAGTITQLLENVVSAPYRKQIVVIDDGGRDGTAAIVERWRLRHFCPVAGSLRRTSPKRGALI